MRAKLTLEVEPTSPPFTCKVELETGIPPKVLVERREFKELY
jgi:hypothetical protein